MNYSQDDSSKTYIKYMISTISQASSIGLFLGCLKALILPLFTIFLSGTVLLIFGGLDGSRTLSDYFQSDFWDSANPVIVACALMLIAAVVFIVSIFLQYSCKKTFAQNDLFDSPNHKFMMFLTYCISIICSLIVILICFFIFR